MAEQRLPIVNSDDGQWGDILNQYLSKEHYNTGVDNIANGGHQNITLRPGTTTAGTAPLKFTSGSLMTAAESGAVEYLTNKFYIRGSDALSVAGNIGAGTTATPSPITAGDVGVETSGVSVSGVTQSAPIYASDATNANTASIILHKHSTTVPPLISASRSNSNTTSHTDVVAGQSLLTIQGTGWSTASYKPSSEIEFQVGTGTVSATSMPGRISLQTTADGAIVPTERMSILADGNVGIGVTSPLAAMHLKAGTATANTAPLKFTSGTNLTAAEAGALEYDGKVYYSTHESTNRGIDLSEQFITLTSAYTTAGGTTALQKLFNSPANGALTVAGSTSYFFECDYSLSAMSTTAGTMSFGFLGTATYTRVRYWSTAIKGVVTPSTAQITLGTVATAVAISASTTTATGHATIRGKIVIGTGGTIIPAYATSQAAASVVAADSHFRIWPVGSNTVQSVGNWS